MKMLFLFGGIIAILLGGLWMGQGAGIVMWPRSSFMLQQTQWVYYGAALLVLGLLMLAYSVRKKG